ncbi:hypothetical protein [uncultured Thiodictyon sp.]|uniref:hypothetical protein n=1 Tax=uncultured Thiodictyon sp. TaxID=1846217 RepID=UPI0025F6D9D5|nr:hypothetical protein [uncultured Thiodictyon sp.]
MPKVADYDPAPGEPDAEEDYDEQQEAMDEVLSKKARRYLLHTSQALGFKGLMMAADNRYIANEDTYLRIAKSAVADQFSSGAAFEAF